MRALQIAVRALGAGELDLALAGAADFSCDPVHEAAACGLGLPGPPGDGAVVSRSSACGRPPRRRPRPGADRRGDRCAAADEPAAETTKAWGRARSLPASAAPTRLRPGARASAVAACAAGRRPGGAPWRASACRLDIARSAGSGSASACVPPSRARSALPSPEAAAEPAAYEAHRPPPLLPPLPVAPIRHAAGAGSGAAAAPESRAAPALPDPRAKRADAAMPPAPRLARLLERVDAARTDLVHCRQPSARRPGARSVGADCVASRPGRARPPCVSRRAGVRAPSISRISRALRSDAARRREQGCHVARSSADLFRAGTVKNQNILAMRPAKGRGGAEGRSPAGERSEADGGPQRQDPAACR